MKNLIVVFVLALITYLLSPIVVNADCVGQYGQYGQYGQPCESFSIVVDKMVGKPGTSTDSNDYEYVDNLSVSDPRFGPDQFVFFKVKIKNTSTSSLGGMEAKDTVPSYVEPVEGPGSYDASTRTLTWDAGSFDVDEEKTFYFKMKVVGESSLPSDKGLLCVTNNVKATSNMSSDEDSSQLCVEKQVLGAVTVPSAGPELGILLMVGNLLGLGIGLKMRKNV